MTRLFAVATVLLASGLAWADANYRNEIEEQLRQRKGITGTVTRTTPVRPKPTVTEPQGIPSPSLPSIQPRRPVDGLNMASEDAYRTQPVPEQARTVSVFRVMCWGLGRGFCNLTLWPGEFARGFTYEFGAREWYWAMGTSWLAGFGGGINRMCAGFADLFSAGYFGDIKLAQGYPDYVWQGDWLYRPTPTYRTRETSSGPDRIRPPETDIKPGTARPR